MFFVGFGLMLACDPVEEKISRDRNATLLFSSDTVIFDTLLSTVGSITKRLRIYNPNENALELDLNVGQLENSPYTITVNGLEGKSFDNEVIFGNDSLTILVTVLIDPQDQDNPYLVKDSLVVQSNQNQYDVKLVSYGQDAIFISQAEFDCDVTLTSERPYVVYGFAVIPENCTLTMEPGARMLFDNDAFLAVSGTLLIQGDTANPVILRNSRLDSNFENTPGQWLGVYFQDGSTGNQVSHAVISNSVIGLSAGNPDNTSEIDVSVTNSVIENMSFAGIFGTDVNMEVINNLIYNCGIYMVANFGGGNYTYYHNTFVNTPNSFIRDAPSVQLANWIPVSETQAVANDINVVMVNNIIWGDLEEELVILEPLGNFQNEFDIRNNIIRSVDTSWEPDNFISVSRNFPGFVNTNNRNYQLDSLAFARDIGLDVGIINDLLDVQRDETPDIGAYERVDQ